VKKARRPASTERRLPRLSQDDRMLIVLRDELYGGSWQMMREDLESRLKNRPHVFRLAFRTADRIAVDLGRIRRLEQMEARHGINLADSIRSGGRG
jgi:hypothetical protein